MFILYSSLTPRDALAFDIKDARQILIEDKVYTKETREKLQGYINEYKNNEKTKEIFKKQDKSNITVACDKNAFK